LREYLGAQRVHQYGKCGDGHFMPYDVEVLLRKSAKYKFYFAFENNIQPGYVSEKCKFLCLHLNAKRKNKDSSKVVGKTLSYGPIPVYYGAPDVPPITNTPSFINVMDFPSPRELAKYLLFLSENEKEYNKYHEWRTDPYFLNPEFLKFLALQRPGVVETNVHADIQGFEIRANRRAACCRLCNESWLKRLAKTHLHEAFGPPKSLAWINHKIFNNTMHDKFPTSVLLKDDSHENDGHDEFSVLKKPPTLL
jgi:hypothetical protein